MKISFCFTLLLLLLAACKQAPRPDGDSMINYPDMEMILHENLEPYQHEPYTFKLTTVIDGKKDTSFLKASQVDWDEWKRPFLQANLYQKKLDKYYDIDVFTDTVLGKMTLLLSALDPKAITSKMSVMARTSDNKIMSVYAETRDAGFISTREYKLLFVNGKTLQVQETRKYPFMDVKRTVKTLSFLN